MSDRSLTYSYLLEKYGLTLSWEQAAEELGVYWERIREKCRDGDIAAGKIGRKWVLTTKALADYIDYGYTRRQNVVPITKQTKHRKYVSL